MQQQIERDIKTALLSGDKEKVETLKGLKNAIQYEAVAKKIKPEEMDEQQVLAVLGREAKKRQEAFQLYTSAGETERAEKEANEKKIIKTYLPDQLSEDEVSLMVNEELQKIENPTIKDMGRLIGAVKARTSGAGDGSLIASLVKKALETN